MTTKAIPATWTPEQVRAWIDRHGGNVSALARRLRVPRGSLQAWAGGSRPTPPYIVALMEALDELARAAVTRAAVLAERERCARIAEEFMAGDEIAAAIRQETEGGA